MKVGRLLVSLLALCSMLAGQDGGLSSVEGQVVNSVTGAPVRRAVMTLSCCSYGGAVWPGEPPSQMMVPRSVETDEQGRFAFRGLQAGGYWIAAQKQGFAGRYDLAANSTGSQLWLGESQQLSGYTVRLTPQSVIAGKVLDEYGDPVMGAQVYAQRAGNPSRTGQPTSTGYAPTNDLGEYRIANLSAGDYFVAAVPQNRNLVNAPNTPPQLIYTTTYHSGAIIIREAASVHVTDGVVVGGVDIKLAKVKGVSISVTIVDPGAPLGSRPYPSLRSRDNLVIPQIGASLVPDGSFHFTAVPPGSYDLFAHWNNTSAVLPVEVRDQNLDGVVLQLKPNSDVQGTVRVEQPGQCDPRRAGVSVGLRSASGVPYSGGSMRASVGDDLKFTLKSVPAGVYSVDLAGGAGRCYVKSIRYGEQAAQENALDVAGSGPLEITLASFSATLTVIPVDRNGKPLPGAGVTLISKDAGGPEAESTADSAGQASFEHVRPGTYEVYAWEGAGQDVPQSPDFLNAFAGRAKTVAIGESGGATVEVSAIPASESGVAAALAFPPNANGSLAGKVVNVVGGAPIAGAYVLLRDSLRNLSEQLRGPGVVTDDQGRFAFPDVQPGLYSITAQRPRFIAAGAGPAVDYATQVIVGEGQQIASYVLKLAPAAVIAGTVTDESGAPVMAARVQVYRYRRDFSSGLRRFAAVRAAQTDDLGKYRLANLPPGDYYVNATWAEPVRGRTAVRMDGFATDPFAALTPPPSPPAATVDSIAGPMPAGPETDYIPVWYPSGVQPAAAAAVRLTVGATAGNIDMTLRKSRVVRIRGRVVDSAGSPVGTPGIALTPKNSPLLASNVGSAVVGRDGSFEISGVPPGSYRLIARPMMVSGGGSMGSAPGMAARSIDVKESSIEGIRLELSAGRTVQGSIRMDGGGPVPQAGYLSLTPLEGGGGGGSNVGAGGSLTIPSVFPLTYTVNFQTLPPDCYVKSIRYGGQEVSREGFEFTGGGDLEIAFSNSAAVLEGSVSGADGKPAGNAGVVVAPSSGPSPARTGNADAHGNFYFASLPPGEYKVLAWDATTPEASDPPESLAPFATAAKTVKLAESAHEKVQVTVVPTGR